MNVKKDAADMEMGAPKNGRPSNRTDKDVVFPTPKYSFSIYAPTTYDPTDGPFKSLWTDFAVVTEKETKQKRTKVKIASLIVKMLNRLIREQVLPREAVQIISSKTFIFAKILVAPSALPILMSRCEKNGVGNVVGVCYASPIETCNLPPPGPVQVVDWDQTRSLHSPWEPSTTKTDTETQKTELLEDLGDRDEYISSEEEDDEEETKISVPVSSINVPLLSPEYKRDLAERVVAARKEWLQTASRVRVEQVAEEVTAGAALSWDYTAFVFCAATVAAVGLGTDSAVTTVASMLISPIMGPVMGVTFGTAIRNKQMIVTSFRNEALSLVICLFVGLFWGFIVGVSPVAENRDWPSSEMVNRGDPMGLVTGILVALPSGMATALSTLGRNSSGMVGVAISLSLLPPAVNAGLCWMYAAMLRTDLASRNEGDKTDYVEVGVISFFLTLVNIVCIWISGVFTFWLKEVAPVSKKNAFWTRDVKNYREQQAQHTDVAADTEIINDGIEAALQLQQDAGNDVYDRDYETRNSRVGPARRQGLADNALEDALYLDGNFGLGGKAVVGGAADDVIPDETALEDMKRRKLMAEALLQNANQFGGLGDAGEALFNDKLVEEVLPEDTLLPSDADGVVHEDVAKKILMGKID